MVCLVNCAFHRLNGSFFQTAFWQLILALAVKLFLTIGTFGVKVPAGLFIPSLAMGAIAGRLLGIQVESFVSTLQRHGSQGGWTCQIGKDCVMPGLYAMVGAAAVLGGVSRMTVSLVVIMFELTGSLEFIVPTMAGVMFAKWVGDAICKEVGFYQLSSSSSKGIYDAHIEMNGYPFLDNKGEYPFSTTAFEVMRTGTEQSPLRVIRNGRMTVGDTENLLRECSFSGFPVVDSDRLVLGFCTRRDLEFALRAARKTHTNVTTQSLVYFTAHLPEQVAEQQLAGPSAHSGGPASLRLRKVMETAPMTVTEHTPMETVIDMFRKLGLRQVLVTRSGQLLGIITKKDVLNFMRDGAEL